MQAAFCLTELANSEDCHAAFELRKVPLPSLSGLPPGSVLIKAVAASICGTDLWGRHEWRCHTSYLKASQLNCGGSGHEVIGDVIDIVPEPDERQEVDDSKMLRIGQRVLAMGPSYIRRIPHVRSAFESHTGVSVSVLPVQGTFAEYLISHSCVCIPIPASPSPFSESSPCSSTSFDPLSMVLAQPLGTVLHAAKKLASVIGKNVAVVGQGQNGLLMTQMLASMGARRVIALDLMQNRLEFARKFKATHTILSSAADGEEQGVECLGGEKGMEAVVEEVRRITKGRMCDVAVDMVGHQARSLKLCTKLVGNDATVLLYGLPAAKELRHEQFIIGAAEFERNIRYVCSHGPCMEFYGLPAAKELRHEQFIIGAAEFERNIRYVCSHGPCMESFELAVEMILQGRFNPAPLITHRIPFKEFPKAYDMASTYKNGVIKVLLTF